MGIGNLGVHASPNVESELQAITGPAVQGLPLHSVFLRHKGRKRHFSAISATMGPDQRLVLWFRNDLRLTDNAALQAAANMIQKKQAAEVRL